MATEKNGCRYRRVGAAGGSSRPNSAKAGMKVIGLEPRPTS